MPDRSPLALARNHAAGARASTSAVSEDELVASLASSGWLRSYVGYASRQTDAPRLFHVAAGLSAISTALGNRVSTRSWGGNIFPNIWICLLAPSGFYRKSTCVKIAVRMLNDVMPAVMLPKDFSREKLVAHLGQRADGLLVAEEFGEFLAKMGRDYMAGSKEMLTGLYDGEGYSRKTMGESVDILDPAIGLLTASTEDWIGDRVTAGDLRGGLLARVLFVAGRQKGESRGLGDGYDPDVRRELLDGLRRRFSLRGEVDYSAVKRELDEYTAGFEGAVNADPDPRLMGFYSRAATHVLKLAICFEAAEEPAGLTIGQESARKAIALWDYLAGSVKTTIADRIATTRTERLMKDVLDFLRGTDVPQSKSAILRRTRILSTDLEPILRTLIERGDIGLVKAKGDAHGRKPQLYAARSFHSFHDETPPDPIDLTSRAGKNGKNAEAESENDATENAMI